MTAPLPCWQDLTSADIAALPQTSTVAILPLAAIEQHGPHLPLSTDLDINLGLLSAAHERLSAATPITVLPPISVGASREHSGYAGTLDVGPDTLRAQIRAAGEAVARAGGRRLLLHNSHGGNSDAAGIAALDLRADRGMLVVQAEYFRFPLADGVLPADEVRHGIHGGALETALMLALAPDKVRAEQVPANQRSRPHRLGARAQAPLAWLAEDLADNGVSGDPSLATAGAGQHLVEHYGTALSELLEETAACPLPASG